MTRSKRDFNVRKNLRNLSTRRFSRGKSGIIFRRRATQFPRIFHIFIYLINIYIIYTHIQRRRWSFWKRMEAPRWSLCKDMHPSRCGLSWPGSAARPRAQSLKCNNTRINIQELTRLSPGMPYYGQVAKKRKNGGISLVKDQRDTSKATGVHWNVCAKFYDAFDIFIRS